MKVIGLKELGLILFYDNVSDRILIQVSRDDSFLFNKASLDNLKYTMILNILKIKKL